MVVGGGMHGGRGYDEIRSMNGRYASYWNAFLLLISFVVLVYLTFILHGVFPLPDSYSDSYSDNMQTVSTGTDSDGHSDAKSQ